MKKLLITTEVITIFLLMAFLPPGGNTYNSSQNGNWTNAATWGGAGSPSANDDVANISHDVTLNANVSNRISITVNAESNLTGPTFDITIKSGATFVVSGTVECDDLTLDNGSEVLVNEGGEIIVKGNFLNKNNSDDVTVNGEITVGGWFDNGNGGEITGDGG
ncbi:MAG: hypothetical protein KKD31_13225, partial [Bacteroidetes bacterium]|nr:hypothetical protein [Bacteroidota bacterium]